MLVNALDGKPLPVYGDGLNVRDWLYVEDHCRAVERVLAAGRVGETYNVGGGNEWRNLDIVRTALPPAGRGVRGRRRSRRAAFRALRPPRAGRRSRSSPS